MGEFLALEVGELLVGAVFFDDHQQVVALEFLFRALDGERDGAGDVDCEGGRAGGEAAHVQAARAHGLDFGGVGLHLVEHHALAGAGAQVLGEGLEHLFVHRRVFDRRVGEYQRARGLEFFRVFGGVGDKVVVVIAIQGVEVAAVLAGVLGGGVAGQACQGENGGQQRG